jgi:hypothetical protein
MHVAHIIFMSGPIFFTFLHVTMWIWIEMKIQLVSIIDVWHKEGYWLNLERNSKAIK